MRNARTILRGGAAAFCALLLVNFLHNNNVYAAAPPVVINEIMYNPASDVDGDEFLEIYNTTSGDIDLTGWCFTAGITLCFNPGTTLAAHDYGVVSPDAARTLATYGKTTVGTYTGKLDNGGERVTLSNGVPEVVSSVRYDDVAPWPTAPDGTGPSLELKDPELDGELAVSWGASVGGSTPGVVNSIFGMGLPEISDVSMPQNVTPTTSPFVTANVDDASSVSLVYRTMFDLEQTTEMFDDGNHEDGDALDGIYGASIPAQAAGTLVRFKISATNDDGTKEKPGSEDTINYYGYVVQDDSVETQLPMLQWFMPDAEYTDMVENHDFDDQQFDCVIAYGNTVIDGAKIWVKGGVDRNFDKKSFAIDLPKGHKLTVPSVLERPVDEFHLDADYMDATRSIVPVAWKIAAQLGMDVPQVFKVRLQKNAQFHGVFTFLEEYDKSWREAFKYDTGNFYKANALKAGPVTDPIDEIDIWRRSLVITKSAARRQYAVDNSDVPNMINYMAFQALMHNCEWHNGKNMMKYHDVVGSNRWKVLPQDLDCSMVSGDAATLTTPYDNSDGRVDRYQFTALYDEPDFRQMYYRRLRTLVDTYFSTDLYLTMLDQEMDAMGNDVYQDVNKWGAWSGVDDARQNTTKIYQRVKRNLLVRYRAAWAVPAEQAAHPVVDINTVTPSPLNQDEEHIVLKNNTSEAIDMSGWKLAEINYTLPPGSVIAAGHTATLVKNDLAFKTAHPGPYIVGQYKNSLSTNTSGKLTLLRADTSQSGVLWY